MRLQVIVLLAIVAIGGLSAHTAHRFFPLLNDPHPALADVAPFDTSPSKSLARRVVLVVADGLRFDASRERPGLDALRARGVDVRARASFPTISKANYVTLMSGVAPRFSGARTNDGFQLHAVDSLFARVHRAGRKASYVADRSRGIAKLFGVDDAEAASWENGLHDVFLRALARSDLVVVLFMRIDEAGHSHGAASDEYAEAVRTVDTQLAALLAGFDFAHDAVVFTADHGHTDCGGHGGSGPDVEDVPLVLAGAGVRRGAVVEANLVDVAPTVAALLGIPPPGHGSGRTLVELLDLSPEHRRALIDADARRAAYLGPNLARIDHDDASRHRSARMWRIPVAIAAASGLIAIVVVLARRRRIVLDRRAVLAAGLFVTLFYLLVFGFDRWRELPSVPSGAGGLWYYSLWYALISLCAHLAVVARVLRRAPDRRASALGIVLAGIVAAAVPALAAWSLAGASLATMLPSTELVIITPVSCVAVAYQAIASVLILIAASVSR